MFDTITVIAYLLGNESGLSDHLRLKAHFLEKQSHIAQVQNAPSPHLKWHGVPPEASSLALIVKDAKNTSDTSKRNYYWVVYNLPIEARELPYGSAGQINKQDEGVNSWGQKNYHTMQIGNKKHPVIVELYALDKRFSAREKMTGEVLEEKIKHHVLAKTTVRG
ncbi:MAG: YbhB/YbcL family Raf kinase inhibitor-like protein [Gammaproteobacteria bacterium]|nr:YbhB/YbcL family Raf kinase inhibitor-like protein [Gammaproteobacteria bacterium]